MYPAFLLVPTILVGPMAADISHSIGSLMDPMLYDLVSRNVAGCHQTQTMLPMINKNWDFSKEGTPKMDGLSL